MLIFGPPAARFFATAQLYSGRVADGGASGLVKLISLVPIQGLHYGKPNADVAEW